MTLNVCVTLVLYDCLLVCQASHQSGSDYDAVCMWLCVYVWLSETPPVARSIRVYQSTTRSISDSVNHQSETHIKFFEAWFTSINSSLLVTDILELFHSHFLPTSPHLPPTFRRLIASFNLCLDKERKWNLTFIILSVYKTVTKHIFKR